MKKIYLTKYAVKTPAAIFTSNSLYAHETKIGAEKEAIERMVKDKEIVSYMVEEIFLTEDIDD